VEQSLLTKLVIVLLLIVATLFFPDVNHLFLFCSIVTNRKQGPQRYFHHLQYCLYHLRANTSNNLLLMPLAPSLDDGFGAANSMPSSNLIESSAPSGATLLPSVRQYGTL
jgi:hypothetical protein